MQYDNNGKVVRHMLKWIRKFLEKLAKENNEAFHGQRLDCCDLNRQNSKQKSIRNNKSHVRQ